MSENYHGVSVRSETTMTDDLKAPERIWVEMPDLFDGMGFWQEHESAKLVEYVRADRIATLEAALADMTQQRDRQYDMNVSLIAKQAQTEAERDAAMAGALSVRELAWEQLGERAWRAPSPLFGSFRVERYGDRLWQALWSVPGICDTFVEGDFATADDAKQAIQARILSALTPDPDRMLALTAAAYEDAVSGLERDIEDREIDAARFRAGTNPHHYRMNLAQAIRYHAAQIRARIPANAIAALSRIEAQAEAAAKGGV